MFRYEAIGKLNASFPTVLRGVYSDHHPYTPSLYIHDVSWKENSKGRCMFASVYISGLNLFRIILK